MKKLLLTALFLPMLCFGNGLKTITLDATNVVSFNEAFSFQSTSKVAQKLLELSKKNDNVIYLFLDTPGGGIQAGLEFIQFVNGLDVKVNTVCNFCASMGFQTVQGIKGKRYLTKFGTMMSHKARGGFFGEFPGQIDSRYEYYKRRLEKLDMITVERSKGKLTLQEYLDMYENEYWCEGRDCISKGLSDEVASFRCGESLSGHVNNTQKFNIGSFTNPMIVKIDYKTSKCPLITGYFDVSISVGGSPYSLTESKDVETNKVIKDLIERHVRVDRNPRMSL